MYTNQEAMDRFAPTIKEKFAMCVLYLLHHAASCFAVLCCVFLCRDVVWLCCEGAPLPDRGPCCVVSCYSMSCHVLSHCAVGRMGPMFAEPPARDLGTVVFSSYDSGADVRYAHTL